MAINCKLVHNDAVCSRFIPNKTEEVEVIPPSSTKSSGSRSVFKKRCSVFGCTSSNQCKLLDPTFHFYSFPKDASLQKAWAFACCRADKFKIANARVCSRHFKEDDYERNLKYELLNYLPRTGRKLKPKAIPSLFLPNRKNPSKSQEERDQRAMRRQSKKLVEEIIKNSTNEKPTLEQKTERLTSGIPGNVETNPHNVISVTVEPDIHFDEETDDKRTVNEFRGLQTTNANTPVALPKFILLKLFKVKIIKKVLNKKDVAVTSDYTKTQSYSVANKNLETVTGISLRFFLKLIQATKRDAKLEMQLEGTLLLFLVKMKFGISFPVLSAVFQIGNAKKASRIFFQQLDLLVQNTKEWLSDVYKQQTSDSSWSKYKVIDCVEITTECPQDQNRHTFHFSFKFLIGVTSNGAIFYVSKTYPGGFGSEDVVRGFDFLDFVQPGDVVATRKTFPDFRTAMERRGATLVSLACQDSSVGQSDRIFEIACLRRQYERTLRRLRTFEILKQVATPYFGDISKFIHMACILTNQTL